MGAYVKRFKNYIHGNFLTFFSCSLGNYKNSKASLGFPESRAAANWPKPPL